MGRVLALYLPVRQAWWPCLLLENWCFCELLKGTLPTPHQQGRGIVPAPRVISVNGGWEAPSAQKPPFRDSWTEAIVINPEREPWLRVP